MNNYSLNPAADTTRKSCTRWTVLFVGLVFVVSKTRTQCLINIFCAGLRNLCNDPWNRGELYS